MIGDSLGKSKTRAVRVQARKPLPISALSACVSSRTIEVLPLCTLPSSQTTGASARAFSAIGMEAATLFIACSRLKMAASIQRCREVLSCTQSSVHPVIEIFGPNLGFQFQRLDLGVQESAQGNRNASKNWASENWASEIWQRIS